MTRKFAKSRVLLRVLRESRRPGAPGLRERLAVVPRMSLAAVTGRYRGLPVTRLGLYALAALYVVWPLDVVPEAVFLGLGLVDDVGVAAWLVGSLLVETDRFLTWERERVRVVPGEVVTDEDRRGR